MISQKKKTKNKNQWSRYIVSQNFGKHLYHFPYTSETLNIQSCFDKKIWLRLFFKVFIILKCIKIIFFYFLKIIFEISVSKRFKIQKKNLFFNKKKIKIFWKRGYNRVSKRSLNQMGYVDKGCWCNKSEWKYYQV